MNSKRNTNLNLYDLSREIEDEINREYEHQAKKIINAYRQVEQLKVIKPKTTQIKQHAQSKPKPQSAYALKVKQTLSQIKSNKTKEIEELNKFVIQPSKHSQKHSHLPKLHKAAINQLFSTIQAYQSKVARSAIQHIQQSAFEDEKRQKEFIKKFRKYKIFRAWKQEVILVKVEKQRQRQCQEANSQQALKAQELSRQYRIFTLLKKSLKAWQALTARQLKRKAYEKQLRRLQLQKTIKQQGKSKKKEVGVAKNQELQSKLRGFLDGLKNKIEDKDRLRTIKEYTEQSDPNIKMRSEPIQEDQENEIQDRKEDQPIEDQSEETYVQQRQNRQSNIQNEVIIQPPSQAAPKKQMTNDQLVKRRQQLEQKHKKRKDALQKLKKQKQKIKKQEELERAEVQREVQAEQKRIKQEKYKMFLKNKQEQEQWERKERQLTTRAGQFNRYRLLKYYGWTSISKLKDQKRKNGQYLYQTLLLITYRIKGKQLLTNLQQNCNEVLENQYEKMQKRYRRLLLAKGLKILSQNKSDQLSTKEELSIRHQVNLVKICFAEWKRVHPSLMVENFDWQRPRNRRAEEFHRLQLLQKSFRGLKENKVQEQRTRVIEQQKKKIKSKIRDMLEEGNDINYEQFL